ncbi:SIMPL domain-containing protein [Sporosarcina sp. P34]|uniref:SIMPL domain-containing protein n=1 Tax=Sporosarcina sp. P34 TaxID=2048247 RepID=UPI000C16DDC8|nr:SIMPL domain-containing protein [Sporosarcina sp. P34]PID15644.1 SIMPL domain-containing protein [Sporosarcina sp. P34]
MFKEQETRMITVFGEGAVKVSPSTVHVVLSVVSRGTELGEIQQENARRMNQVIQSLQKAGVAEASIQTTDFQIRPVYDYVNGEQRFQGYEVINSIRMTSDELSRTGEFVDLAVKNGANQIGSIEFTMPNSDKHYQRALVLALQDAETKMITIGTSLKLQNRPIPLKIEEQHTSQPVAFRAVAMADTGKTPIESGTMTIRASLQVKYQIV